MRRILITVCYLASMLVFMRDIWFNRNPYNSSHSLVVWDDMVYLRYLCLVVAILFAVLTVVALFRRHRSLMLLWFGTLVLSTVLLIIPCGPTEGEMLHPSATLFLGMIAHLSVLIIHDRVLPNQAYRI